MKNFLLLAFICLTVNISAQDIVVTPNPVHEWETESDIEILGDAVIKNESSDTKTYTWERTVICENNNIDTWFCDPNVCYTPAVSTQMFTLAPGEEGPFQLHANFTSTEDRALTVQIKVYENGNEGNVVDVMYELNDCAAITSIEDVKISEINLFPNPTTDNFTLTNIDGVQDVIINNIIGTPLKQYVAEENGIYSMGDLPAGIYMVQLIDANGKNIGSKRVFKQ